jgi:uncharacterized protein YeaO (DUF488 family)
MNKSGVMVKTKSVYDPVEKSDGERILVSRYWPRGFSKELLSAKHLKDVAPSKKLLKDWKDRKITWDEYKERYYQGMLSQQEKIKELAERAKHRTITLLCFEREENPQCHRHLLKKLIDDEK